MDYYVSTEDIKHHLKGGGIVAKFRTIQRDLNSLKEHLLWNVEIMISLMVGIGGLLGYEWF